MRDFFIGALDKLITVIVILMIIGVVGASLFTMFSSQGGFLGGRPRTGAPVKNAQAFGRASPG